MKKIDEKIEKMIIEYYTNGNSCRITGKKFNVSEATVHNILKRNNIKARTNGGIDELPQNEIVQSYKSKIRVTEIAKRYNVDVKTIYNCLKANNINANIRYLNSNLDIDYFNYIDRYDKAYFLGMLIADGCVMDDNSISISLKESDSNILKILNQKINNENPLYISKRGEAILRFKSLDIKKSLEQYGVVPRKTFTVDMPMLDEDVMPHLIRGLIDGDGWISVASHTIGFCGNVKIVTRLRNYLVEKLDVYPVKIMHPRENLYQIGWSSKRDIDLIGNYIYENKQDCYLERKYENFMVIPR